MVMRLIISYTKSLHICKESMKTSSRRGGKTGNEHGQLVEKHIQMECLNFKTV